MNERGVSLFQLIGVIIIVGALFTVVFPGVNTLLGNGKLGTFIAYESTMEDAAAESVKNCVANGNLDCVNPSKGESKNIQLIYLVTKGYINEIKAPNGEKCDLEKSYVKVIGNGNLKF